MQRQSKFFAWLSVLLLGVIIGLGISISLHRTSEVAARQTGIAPPSPSVVEVPAAVRALQDTFAAVAEAVKPAVVYISAEKVVRLRNPLEDFFGDDFFRFFFGPRFEPPEQEFRQEGLGTGVIVDRRGYILTNNHVVEGAEELTVRLADKREFAAEMVGTDPDTDLAVIKIEGENLPVARMGDSSQLKVGHWVLAIGNPFGLAHTVSAGIVSAVGRTDVHIAQYEDFIQTDAAINPGNSGGPLVNLRGEVVGINTAIFSQSGGSNGVGFAIPINLARWVMEQLISGKGIERGYLGVLLQPMDRALAERFGRETAEGALIAQVEKGSPADKAGLKAGDIVLEFDGRPIEDLYELRNLVAQTPPGKKVKVKIWRHSQEKTLTVKLGSREVQAAVQAAKQRKALGLTVQDITPELARRFGLEEEQGVVIVAVEPNSLAARAGLRPGDVIAEVDRKPVRNGREFEQALADANLEEGILLLVVRRGIPQYLLLRQ
ncbi:MAG TPA: DegQ family serine endoprotease [Armatimonadetes bacterium]|nr:DegQ family serine endoprotease [Armatimonadota bacterium]